MRSTCILTLTKYWHWLNQRQTIVLSRIHTEKSKQFKMCQCQNVLFIETYLSIKCEEDQVAMVNNSNHPAKTSDRGNNDCLAHDSGNSTTVELPQSCVKPSIYPSVSSSTIHYPQCTVSSHNMPPIHKEPKTQRERAIQTRYEGNTWSGLMPRGKTPAQSICTTQYYINTWTMYSLASEEVGK